jgi:hypothetical protein
MSSSAEAAVAAADPRATGWAVPRTDGGVVVPWVTFVIGEDGPMAMLPPGEIVDRGDDAWELRASDDRFEGVQRWSALDAAGGRDVEVELTWRGAEPAMLSLAFALSLEPSDDPWFLVPGLFYGSNGPADPDVHYPRFAKGAWDEATMTAERWAFRADRAATPVVLASDGRRSVALAIEETTALGLSGVSFGADDASTGIGWFAPYHEQPWGYDGGPVARPGGPTFRRWAPGERQSVRCRVYLAGPERTAFVPILRDLHARATGTPVAAIPDLETTASLAAEGLLRWHRLPGQPILLETASFERGPGPAVPGSLPGDRLAMHVAWLSGAPAASALLRHGRRTGDGAAVDAGIAVLDAISANLAPGGTFWGQWSQANGWAKGWTPGPNALHARTLGEATLSVARAAIRERTLGHEHASWVRAVASTLDATIHSQRDDGRFPAAIDGVSGSPLGWDGDGGMAWVPALLVGAELLDRPLWRDAAAHAGDGYARDVEAAFLHGAPEDVGLAPSSEDGDVAVMAYTALAAAASDDAARDRWRALAVLAAEWSLTFRYTYDVTFDPATTLGRAGFRTRGLDQASVANQHLHVYGLVCLPELRELARATGDPYLATRAREHLDAARQTLVTVDGEWNGLRGMAAERWYQTTCFGPKGGIGALSHAGCLGLLLDAAESALEEEDR